MLFYVSHLEHLHHLVAKVIDDFHGDRPAGRLNPSTSSLSDLVPSRARAWFRSFTSPVSPNRELLTHPQDPAGHGGIVFDTIFQLAAIDLRIGVSSRT